jgi:hypothetical protein
VSFGTSSIDPGAAPSLAVATDAIASALYQRVKQANPNADQTGAYGIDSDPVRVRPRRRGIADYDSGPVAVPNSAPAAVTAAAIYPEGGYVVNSSAVPVEVTVTDTAGNLLFFQEIAPKKTEQLPFTPGMGITGLKWGANAAGISGQVWGAQ